MFAHRGVLLDERHDPRQTSVATCDSVEADAIKTSRDYYAGCGCAPYRSFVLSPRIIVLKRYQSIHGIHPIGESVLELNFELTDRLPIGAFKAAWTEQQRDDYANTRGVPVRNRAGNSIACHSFRLASMPK